MTATAGLSVNTDHAVREVIDEATRLDGPKRGLFRAAELLGVTERWLRGFRYGEPARVTAETYLRALDARQALREERRARLLAELRDIEAAAHAEARAELVSGQGLGGLLCGRGSVGSRRPGADAPGPARAA
jgi:hypothetical protein